VVDLKNRLFVSAVRWTAKLVETLPEGVAGVILGDPFCQKRMFKNAAFDLPEFARRCKAQGLQVAYQTPVYNTPRSIDSTLALARLLAEADVVDVFLVHDVGVLHSLRSFGNVEVWWDRYSLNRDMDISAALMDFLRNQGVSAVELTRGMDLPRAARAGLKAGLHIFGPNVAAFGRACYTEYLLGEPCEQKILCKGTLPEIESVDKVRLEYIADGYTLVEREPAMLTTPKLMPGQAEVLRFGTATIRSADEAKVALDIYSDLMEH